MLLASSIVCPITTVTELPGSVARKAPPVAVEGTCKVYERGPEYLRLLNLLMKRFEFYRKNPWGEGESPIFLVTPQKAVSWGL